MKRLSKIEPGQSEVVQLPVQELLKMMGDGRIVFYENNRGNGKILSTRARRMAENLTLLGFGVVSLAQVAGTVDHFKVADGHTRLKALMIAEKEGLLTSVELATQVLVRIHAEEDFLLAYAILNDEKGHTGSDKVTNQDLAYGKVLHDLVERVPRAKLGATHLMTLADVLTGRTQHARTAPDFMEFCKTRKVTESHLNAAPGQVGAEIAQSAVREAENVLVLYRNIQDELRSRVADRDDSIVNELIGTPGLLILLALDAGRGGVRTLGAQKIADALYREASACVGYCRSIGRRNQRVTQVEPLLKILGLRKSSIEVWMSEIFPNERTFQDRHSGVVARVRGLADATI